jgi:DNA (cytosine-5)-methyltransferase 1
MVMIKRPTVIDFFCGAGGFSEGFRKAGFDVVMGIDNWLPAMMTHNANHGLNDSVKDILDFESIEEIHKLPNTDVIVGSPPCVLFSLSNRGGNANKDLGVRLIKAFYRVIAVKKHQKGSILKAWLMENVPNSRNYVDPSYTFDDLDLGDWAKAEGLNPEDIAIKVKYNGDILSSNDYGSGQTRKRFVCGEVIKTGAFPQPDKAANTNVTLDHLFRGFPEPMVASNKLKTKLIDPNYPEDVILTSNLHDHFYDTGVYEIDWQKARNAKKHHPYMGVMSFPENRQKPGRTIMATKSSSTREALLYKSELNRTGDGEYRTPTIREAATIMGFPLTYEFYGTASTKWRQIGNAVCVQLSFALATKVRESLGIKDLKPKEVTKDLSNIAFLDNPEPKTFSSPPKRNPSALFRAHPIKSGNITVDLINKGAEGHPGWSVVAHAGTGKGYASTVITGAHREVVKGHLLKICPKFVEAVDGDPVIRRYDISELQKHNEEYGYISTDETHPYNVIKRISGYISSTIEDNDTPISTKDSLLSELKSTIPVSQAMSIYAMGALVGDE